MKETFYLSNIIPQDLENNKGFWFRMEAYCRSLANKFSNVYIISGPLFVPTFTPKKGIREVKYKVIGENRVAVPSHLYKVILVEDGGKPIALGSFLVPNAEIPENKTLRDHQVPLEELEKLAGIDFFPKLQSNRIQNLCHLEGCKLMKKKFADAVFSKESKKNEKK